MDNYTSVLNFPPEGHQLKARNTRIRYVFMQSPLLTKPWVEPLIGMSASRKYPCNVPASQQERV